MSDFNSRFPQAIPAPADMAVDAGLRAFMLSVYNKLALGLIVAGALALLTGTVPEVQQIMFRVSAEGRFAGYTPIGMVVVFAPLVLLFGSMFFMKNPTAGGANLLYWLVVASVGASTGVVFLIYLGGSIATTFFITAAAFGALSLWGYTTKRNLSAFGSFLIMGVVGLLIAMVVNMFLQNEIIYLITSAVGVFLFAGLIAFDTQNLKMQYYAVGGDRNMLGVLSSWGALNLFINFINLFRFLLVFFGARR